MTMKIFSWIFCLTFCYTYVLGVAVSPNRSDIFSLIEKIWLHSRKRHVESTSFRDAKTPENMKMRTFAHTTNTTSDEKSTTGDCVSDDSQMLPSDETVKLLSDENPKGKSGSRANDILTNNAEPYSLTLDTQNTLSINTISISEKSQAHSLLKKLKFHVGNVYPNHGASVKPTQPSNSSTSGRNFLPSKDDYPFELLLPFSGSETTGKAIFRWDYNEPQNKLRFELSFCCFTDQEYIDKNTWIFGLSYDGHEGDTDVIVVEWSRGFEGRRSVRLTDAHTDEIGFLHRDFNQDYKLTGSDVITNDRGRGVRATVSVVRKLVTDDVEDVNIEQGTIHVFFMTLVRRPISLKRKLDFSQTDVSVRPVTLLKSKRKPPPLPADVGTQLFAVTNVSVPSENSATYWCKVFEFMGLATKHHMIRYESAIEEGNEDVVHHIEIYHCEVTTDVNLPYYEGPCDDPSKPRALQECKHVIAAWAMGAEEQFLKPSAKLSYKVSYERESKAEADFRSFHGNQPFILPSEAGTPIGGPSWSPYVMMEIHYEHPKNNRDVIDSSGIRLYYTPSLREYDAGVLEVGVSYLPNLFIPPHEKDFELSGYCTSRCTDMGIPSSGIKVFASQLHTHMTGRAVRTRHFRNGQELLDIDHDEHFTASFQEIKLLMNEVHVLPNDSLITSCRYDTRGRRRVTLGGFSNEEEMCVNYLHYYPKSNLEVCKSTLSTSTLKSFLRQSMRRMIELNTTEELQEGIKSLAWDSRRRAAYSTLIQFGEIDEECLQSSGLPFEGSWENLPISKTVTTTNTGD